MAAVALAVTLLTICSVTGTEHPTVAVQQGTLQGVKLETVWGKEYLAFLGIPYAKPPVGDLRFRVSYMSRFWSILA
jgi:carboxylesterase type B